MSLYEFECLQRNRQNGKWSKKKKYTIIGAELHRGHGGEDKAFGECPEALSGIRPWGAQLLATEVQSARWCPQECCNSQHCVLLQIAQSYFCWCSHPRWVSSLVYYYWTGLEHVWGGKKINYYCENVCNHSWKFEVWVNYLCPLVVIWGTMLQLTLCSDCVCVPACLPACWVSRCCTLVSRLLH